MSQSLGSIGEMVPKRFLRLEVGDLISLKGGVARVVTNLTPNRVLELLHHHQTVSEILNMTMMWSEVPSDTGGFVVSKLEDPKTSFDMYFVLVMGRIVTIYGLMDGIEVTCSVKDDV